VAVSSKFSNLKVCTDLEDFDHFKPRETAANSVNSLDFSNPALLPLAQAHQPHTFANGSEMGSLESLIEDKYLRHCDPEIPLHFMTIVCIDIRSLRVFLGIESAMHDSRKCY